MHNSDILHKEETFSSTLFAIISKQVSRLTTALCPEVTAKLRS